MSVDTSSVFLSISPQHVRNVLHEYVKAVKFDKYIMPAVGSFSGAQVLCRAGIAPAQIMCSDISLTSTALGSFLTDKPLEKLGIQMDNIPFSLDYYESDRDKLAELFLAMRYDMNSKEKSYYFKAVMKEMVVNKTNYHKNICEQLDEMYKIMHGIKYHVGDMLKEIDKYKDENALIYVAPPTSKNTDFVNIVWNKPSIPELDVKDFENFYPVMLNKKATVICEEKGDYETPKGWTKLSAEDKDEENTERLLLNKKVPVGFMKRKKMKMIQPKWRMYNDENITKKSVIKCTKIQQDEAFYYRDLFIHKLGATGADMTFAFTIDGNLLAVTGMSPDMLYGRPSSGEKSDGRLHEKDYMFQVYGLTIPSERYKRIGRLLAYFITCKEFKDDLEQLEPSLQMVNMKSIRSNALTHAPEQRLVHGLMKRVSRERLPNQMFKLQYTTEFHNRSYKECIIKWVDEAKREEQMAQKVENG